MNITGGWGAYLINATLDGVSLVQYYDRGLGTHDVAIWTSDQGCSVPEHHVCYDVKLVLRIVKRLLDTGELDTGVSWADPFERSD